MGLSAASIRRGEAQSSEGDHIPKTELVGSLIAFAVNSYDPNFAGQYGVQPKADIDLLVVDGTHAGAHDPSWITYGNLARQLGSQAKGATIAARIVSGPGKTAGSKWFGAEFDLSDAELQQVRQAVLDIGSAPAKRQEAVPASENVPF